MLWIIFFINIACGLGLISAASPMAQEMAGLSTSHAAVMVGVLGIFNGFVACSGRVCLTISVAL